MRTTIEIDDETLKKLRDLASERGERGYSRLINEALERYLTAAGFDGYHDLERWVTYQYIEPLWAAMLADTSGGTDGICGAAIPPATAPVLPPMSGTVPAATIVCR